MPLLRPNLVQPAVVALALALLAGCGSASSPAPAAQTSTSPGAPKAPGSAATYDQVVEAAKKEGEVVWWGVAPRKDTLDKMQAAFEKRVGFKITLTVVQVSAKDMGTRIITEAQSKRSTGDAMWGTLVNLVPLEDRQLLDTYPWVETFGAQFPDIKRYVDVVPAPFTGKALEFYDKTDGLAFYTKSMSADQLPKTWEALADPKFKGKFAVDQSGATFGSLVYTMSEDDLQNLVRKIAANQPVLSKGSPESVEMVASAQVPMAFASTASLIAKKQTGAPLDFRLVDPTPVDQSAVYLSKYTPHPNLARLWAAWFVTEGRPFYAEPEGRLVATDPGSLSDMLKATGINLVQAKNVDQLKAQANLQDKLADILTKK